jgi:phage FluMu protein Com
MWGINYYTNITNTSTLFTFASGEVRGGIECAIYWVLTGRCQVCNRKIVKIGADIAKKCPHITPKNRIYATPENKQKYNIEEVEFDTILDEVKNISIYKSSGMENASAAFVKGALTVLIQEFTHLCNLVISEGIFPDKWKVATVTPIPKINTPNTCNDLPPTYPRKNYRTSYT